MPFCAVCGSIDSVVYGRALNANLDLDGREEANPCWSRPARSRTWRTRRDPADALAHRRRGAARRNSPDVGPRPGL